MGPAPPVSVLLPVRDGAAWLGEALESLAAQTFEAFEVVVQDDGSRDASPAIARAFASRDSRVRAASGPPRGIVHALRTACARARGGLWVRMDADDVAAPQRLASLHAFAVAHPEVGLLGSRVRYFPRAAVRAGMLRYEAWVNQALTHEEILRERFVECPLPHPSWAVRREAMERLGGYRAGPFPEDYEFLLRAAASGVRLARLPEVLLHWREHEGRLCRTDPRYARARFLDLKLRFLLPLLQREGRPVAIVGAGTDGKRWARALGAAGVAVTHFVDLHPRRLGQRIHGAQVVGYEALEELRGCFLLAAVGGDGGREEVRRHLGAAGLHEGAAFLCVQ